MTLYRLTNTKTGMSYVGATTRTLAQRMGDHRSQANQGLSHPLSHAIREDGWPAFTVTILATFSTVAELYAAERATIAALGTMMPAGYNRASGGLGTPDCKHAESTRAKIAARALGRPGHAAWNKGIPTPPDVVAKRVEKLKGRVAWNKGVNATDAHRAALRASHVGKLSPAARAVEFDGQQFATIREAADALGLTRMQARYRLQKGTARYL
jgi:group I intron endonuclease